MLFNDAMVDFEKKRILENGNGLVSAKLTDCRSDTQNA